jgi:hypothetical protein
MRLRLILLLLVLLGGAAQLLYRANHHAPAPQVSATTHASTQVVEHPNATPTRKPFVAVEKDNSDEIDPVASYEDLMYAQPDLIDASLKQLRAQTPGKIDLYAIGFAGDAAEPPFRNEVEYLPTLLAQRFDAAGHTVELINSPKTFERTPLATRTNLYEALAGVAKKMDVDEDVLLLFLTSHGSPEHELYVEMGAMPLDQLTPEDVRDALDAAHIRWRIVVVSACYSGGFIPALRDPRTLVITAARSDRASFGCGNDSQITWFGKAFLTQALNQTTDFHDAFLRTRQTIAGWETRDHETPSEPQYWAGSEIQKKLDAWHVSLASAPATTFEPAREVQKKPVGAGH